MRGSVHKRVSKTGIPTYHVVFRDHTGRQRWKGFPTARKADDFLSQSVTAVHAGTYRHVTSVTMADLFTAWRAQLTADQQLGTIKRSTARAYLSILAQHLEPAWRTWRSDQLTAADLQAWRTAQATRVVTGELAAKTWNNVVTLLRGILDWAVEQQALPANPMPPAKKMRAKGTKTVRSIIQGAEITRLWAAATGQDQVIVGLALFAGLRRGEVFGLRWDDVTWPRGSQRGRLFITNNFVQREMTAPKTAAGRRSIDLPPRLVEVLRAHERTAPPRTNADGHALVIRQADGRPVDPDNWASDVFPALRAAAKLSPAITLHSLRHTFGSLLLADQAPLKYVSEQMGHGSVAFTMDEYQHILRSTTATASRKLDRHIPAAPPRPRPRLVAHGGQLRPTST